MFEIWYVNIGKGKCEIWAVKREMDINSNADEL